MSIEKGSGRKANRASAPAVVTELDGKPITKVKGARSKGPADKVKPTPDGYGFGALGITSATRLAAALVPYGASAASARLGLMRALSTELLLATSGPSEKQAAKIMAVLRADQTFDADVASSAVLAAYRRGGPMAIAELASAIAWRIGAAAADGADAELIAKSGRALDSIVDAGIAHLTPHAPADVRDAIATNVALSALLSRGQTNDTGYHAAANGRYASHFDAFTNESGLPAAVRLLGPTGGALVGVSGGALHIAAQIRAELAVIVDINPEIRDFVLVLGAAAMVLTDQVKRKGGGDAELVDAIHRHLLGPERGDATFVRRLRDAGLPGPLAGRAAAMLQAVYAQSGVNLKQVWLAPEGADFRHANIGVGAGGTTAEVAANFRHLAVMARSGALVAAVMDLSDPSALDRVGKLLTHKGSLLQAVHLSNALEYVLDPVGIVDQISALPRVENALVVSSTGSGNPDPRMGNWYTPGVNSIQTWLAPDGIRSHLKAGTQLSAVLRGAFLPYEAGAKIPSDETISPKALRTQIQRIIDEHYAQASFALETLAYQLICGGVGGSVGDVLAKLEALGVQPPGGPDEVRALTRALLPILSAPASTA